MAITWHLCFNNTRSYESEKWKHLKHTKIGLIHNYVDYLKFFSTLNHLHIILYGYSGRLTAWEFIEFMIKNVNILFFPGFVPFFRNKFPGLFQDPDWFFKSSKIHINPYTAKIAMLILLTALHALHMATVKRFQSWHFERLVEFNIFPEPSRTFQSRKMPE